MMLDDNKTILINYLRTINIKSDVIINTIAKVSKARRVDIATNTFACSLNKLGEEMVINFLPNLFNITDINIQYSNRTLHLKDEITINLLAPGEYNIWQFKNQSVVLKTDKNTTIGHVENNTINSYQNDQLMSEKASVKDTYNGNNYYSSTYYGNGFAIKKIVYYDNKEQYFLYQNIVNDDIINLLGCPISKEQFDQLMMDIKKEKRLI